MLKDILNILGVKVAPGKSATVTFEVAKLHTRNTLDVPIIIERSKKLGPTVLITAGIHGDEINGVEIVRQIIAKGINKPKIGTTICVPVINVFGFLNMDRLFPDGRDLNRVFPGSEKGSLASRVAHFVMKELVPHADFVMDFHTGGSDRFNASQIRIVEDDPKLTELAHVFGAPFIYYSQNLNKSFRNACAKAGVPMLLFEGGKSFNIHSNITNTGVNGAKRVLHHFGMLRNQFKVSQPKTSAVVIEDSKWLRAKYSGMFKATVKINTLVEKGEVLGNITDPYGSFNYFVKAPNTGYVFNVNESPIIYQGDAIFHISTKLED
ncbi:succinylglutamate desuccinylase/aspartoacylase family protein [Winogradskyella sp.]|nr:succinylglutamate desuccinylase/aspartoacylase family protein [Winogradskyella sp.]MDB9755041.1 succinylglutamate desuccinylase/aspartoacylase family protein [Winogradskyella sp.]MDB9781693.1 succinylglutamate desuccinylase/aspartoacylase family protein [Winogradskyella sp.]MDC0006455.1 succinylglutamate desuccinylase/aspartoacylase family protein [Winogradskyella sp.]MDC1503839.1 succinylglutamate desuccinylase/aspartoacylase family protein [Winogradskyella sp.]